MRCLLVGALLPMLALGSGWMRTYGEENRSEWSYFVRQTADEGYIVVGGLYDSESDSWDLLLIKTDSLGDTLWTRTYEGPGNDEGLCVQQTKEGGYIITGYRNGPTEPPPWPAGDLWLIKTDAEGIIEWDRTYGGSYYSKGCWVEQTSDEGYIVTGNLDQTYLWILKTDENGFEDWEKTYEWGDYHETGYCIRPTNGGYIVATNMGLFRTDDKGDSLWLKPWAGHFVALTDDGGHFVLSGQNNDMWLIKTDEQGDTLWTRTYGGNDADAAWSAQQTSVGGYIIVGETRSFGAGNYDIWLLKTDSLGDTVWTRTFGDKYGDHGYSVQQTSDGGYVITGSIASLENMGDALLIKTDSLGYVGVKEEPPVQVESNWQVISSIGPHITLRYTDRPDGFHASIYDATGRKVDELRSANHSGTITWGECYGPGVYFIREESKNLTTIQKVILIR